MPRSDLLRRVMEHVYSDRVELTYDVAREHTIANMGAALEDFIHGYMQPEHAVKSAYAEFRSAYGHEMGDEAQGVDAECCSWVEQAHEDVAMVVAAGLPLTLSNARAAFERRPPFDGKKPA